MNCLQTRILASARATLISVVRAQYANFDGFLGQDAHAVLDASRSGGISWMAEKTDVCPRRLVAVVDVRQPNPP